MTPKQITVVQTSFKAKIWPMANEAATLFYDCLFELNPALRTLFNHDMSEQWRKLMEMLWLVVHGLDEAEIDELNLLLESLGERHVSYGVQPEYYQSVEVALLSMVESCLKRDFTAEAEDAWRAVYKLMADGMKQANYS